MSDRSYKAKIAEATAEEKRASRIDYDNTAFMMKRPHSHTIVDGPFRVINHKQHLELLESARKRKLYVWYAHINKRGDKFFLTEPHLIDWSSIPERAYGGISKADLSDKEVVEYPDNLVCQKCGLKLLSKSGYTLHTKSCSGDVIPDLICKHCGKTCSSTSGLSLHIKHQHSSE